VKKETAEEKGILNEGITKKKEKYVVILTGHYKECYRKRLFRKTYLVQSIRSAGKGKGEEEASTAWRT